VEEIARVVAGNFHHAAVQQQSSFHLGETFLRNQPFPAMPKTRTPKLRFQTVVLKDHTPNHTEFGRRPLAFDGAL
jgi:hypothetical protein